MPVTRVLVHGIRASLVRGAVTDAPLLLGVAQFGQRAGFGIQRSQVRILSPRPTRDGLMAGWLIVTQQMKVRVFLSGPRLESYPPYEQIPNTITA